MITNLQQLVKEVLEQTEFTLVDSSDECVDSGDRPWLTDSAVVYRPDIVSPEKDGEKDSGSQKGKGKKGKKGKKVDGKAEDCGVFSDVLDSLDDDQTAGKGGGDGMKRMEFTIKIDPVKYAARFGVKIPDDSSDLSLTEDCGIRGVPSKKIEGNAQDATITYSGNTRDWARQCQATLEECRAQNPMTCRFHGTQAIAQDIEQQLRAAGIPGNVSVEFLGVSRENGHQYLSVKACVDAPASQEAAVKQAMQAFYQNPGVLGDADDIDENHEHQRQALFDIDMLDPNAKADWGLRDREEPAAEPAAPEQEHAEPASEATPAAEPAPEESTTTPNTPSSEMIREAANSLREGTTMTDAAATGFIEEAIANPQSSVANSVISQLGQGNPITDYLLEQRGETNSPLYSGNRTGTASAFSETLAPEDAPEANGELNTIDDAVRQAVSDAASVGNGFTSASALREAINGAMVGNEDDLNYLRRKIGENSPVFDWIRNHTENPFEHNQEPAAAEATHEPAAAPAAEPAAESPAPEPEAAAPATEPAPAATPASSAEPVIPQELLNQQAMLQREIEEANHRLRLAQQAQEWARQMVESAPESMRETSQRVLETANNELDRVTSGLERKNAELAEVNAAIEAERQRLEMQRLPVYPSQYVDANGTAHQIEHGEGGIKAQVTDSELAAVERMKGKAFGDAANGVEGAEEYAHAISRFLGRGTENAPGLRSKPEKYRLLEKMESRLNEKSEAIEAAERDHGRNSDEYQDAVADFKATQQAVRDIAGALNVRPGDCVGDNCEKTRAAIESMNTASAQQPQASAATEATPAQEPITAEQEEEPSRADFRLPENFSDEQNNAWESFVRSGPGGSAQIDGLERVLRDRFGVNVDFDDVTARDLDTLMLSDISDPQSRAAVEQVINKYRTNGNSSTYSYGGNGGTAGVQVSTGRGINSTSVSGLNTEDGNALALRVRNAMRNSRLGNPGNFEVDIQGSDKVNNPRALDLPVALALAKANGRMTGANGSHDLSEYASIGSLGLTGELSYDHSPSAIADVRNAVREAKRIGRRAILVPSELAEEASAGITGIDVIPVRTLREATGYLNGEININPVYADLDSNPELRQRIESAESAVGNQRNAEPTRVVNNDRISNLREWQTHNDGHPYFIRGMNDNEWYHYDPSTNQIREVHNVELDQPTDEFGRTRNWIGVEPRHVTNYELGDVVNLGESSATNSTAAQPAIAQPSQSQASAAEPSAATSQNNNVGESSQSPATPQARQSAPQTNTTQEDDDRVTPTQVRDLAERIHSQNGGLGSVDAIEDVLWNIANGQEDARLRSIGWTPEDAMNRYFRGDLANDPTVRAIREQMAAGRQNNQAPAPAATPAPVAPATPQTERSRAIASERHRQLESVNHNPGTAAVMADEVEQNTGVSEAEAQQQSQANADNIQRANPAYPINAGHIRDAIVLKHNLESEARRLRESGDEDSAVINENAARAISTFARTEGGMAQRGADGQFNQTNRSVVNHMVSYLKRARGRAAERHGDSEASIRGSRGVAGVERAITAMGAALGFTPRFSNNEVTFDWGDGSSDAVSFDQVGDWQPSTRPRPARTHRAASTQNQPAPAPTAAPVSQQPAEQPAPQPTPAPAQTQVATPAPAATANPGAAQRLTQAMANVRSPAARAILERIRNRAQNR